MGVWWTVSEPVAEGSMTAEITIHVVDIEECS